MQKKKKDDADKKRRIREKEKEKAAEIKRLKQIESIKRERSNSVTNIGNTNYR